MPHEFGFLQIRPLVLWAETRDVDLENFASEDTICQAEQVLGNGHIREVRDVVYVRPENLDRSKTSAIAAEIGSVNAKLRAAKRPYLLIGPGRWGSADPWLGVPVKWSQISGVRCMVETDLSEIHVEPSQGSHFFQNITSFGIGYLTVNHASGTGTVNYKWLDGLPAVNETSLLRHVAFDRALDIVLDNRKNRGVVLKPGITMTPRR
jgi:hypothetical protein